MLTAMTYNVGNGLAPAPNLMRYLRTAAADLVGLQEVAAEQAEALASQLTDLYPYRVLYGTGISGKGVLSRFPLRETRQLPLAPGRPDLCVKADVGGVHLTVLIAHPPPPRWRNLRQRSAQATTGQLARLANLAVADTPAVLMGDFNMVTRSAGHALLRSAGLTDAFQLCGSGAGFTLPARVGYSERLDLALGWPLIPFLRVDYIWLTQEVVATRCWTERGAGSDHRPVLARLKLIAAQADAVPEVPGRSNA